MFELWRDDQVNVKWNNNDNTKILFYQLVYILEIMDHMYDTKQKRFQNTAKHLRTFCEKSKGF